MTKRKTFLAGLYVAIVYIIVILYMTSCGGRPERHRTPTKQATEVINHSDKSIIIETLHEGYINRGVYKISIDSNQYVVVAIHDAIAITKHN